MKAEKVLKNPSQERSAMPHEFVPTSRRDTARRLRRDQTELERKLWQALKANRFDGLHFRRQAPMGPYVVDFVSHEARVVIELDGTQHGLDGQAAKDRVRDAWLAERGYKVLRFWNHEVSNHLDGVLAAIGEAARSQGPLSQPSPARGEGLSRDTSEGGTSDNNVSRGSVQEESNR